MSTPPDPQENSSTGDTPEFYPNTDHFLEKIAGMKKLLAKSREMIPPHPKLAPHWELHERRLDEIEVLVRAGRQEDDKRIEELNTHFLLNLEADMAASMAESSEKLLHSTDAAASASPTSPPS